MNVNVMLSNISFYDFIFTFAVLLVFITVLSLI